MNNNGHKLPIYRQSLAGTLLRAREAVMAPIRPVLRGAGVTEQQWRALRVLAYEGPLDTTGLADAAMLHGPSLTRILRELVERDLVVRQTDPEDGRRSIASISPRGLALVEGVASRTVLILNDYGREFGPERLAALRREIAALADTLALHGKGKDRPES